VFDIMIDYSISGSVALLRLDDPPLNILSYDMLGALTDAVDRANSNATIKGIVLTGADDHFSAGADVNIFKAIATDDEAIELSRRFQEAFDRIERSPKPVAAALSGSVMGGALELALAAHFRVCAPSTRFSMPEVNLGLLPGAGGTQRLPRTIGLEAALTMFLSAKPVDAKEALVIGLVDEVCDLSELIACAQRFAVSGKKPVVGSERTDKIADARVNAAALEKAAKKAAGVRGEIIAPLRIIDAVETGIKHSYREGLAAEQTGFARCMATPAARNKIYLFFATRDAPKAPGCDTIKPAPITSAAVIGMGSMGTGIAQAIAASGKKVLVLDTDPQTAKKGIARIAWSIERKVERGALTRQKADAVLGRITVAEHWDEIGGTDLVIEAIFEDIALKQSLMERVGALCPSTTVVASNTSTIDLDRLALNLPHPERLVGLHFFNPAHSMPLVEVIRRGATAAGVVATSMQFVKELRKTPLLVNNSVGFVVNRIFIPYFIEAFQLLEEGAAPRDIDTAMEAFGFSMGPLTLIDMTGIDILFFTDRIMHAAYPYHIPLSRIASALVDENLLGQKTGCGIYRYESDGRTPLPSDRTDEIVSRVRNGAAQRTFSRAEITDRLVLRIVAEAFRVIEEKVALREPDIDVALALGAGFPDFRAGPVKYARDAGLEIIAERLAGLAAACGERYQPCHYIQSNIEESHHG
jgi:3-hydroxyacyl-CoA dehydrogenase